jgi:dGTPase
MYFHYRVVRMAQKASRIIKDLFYAYLSEPRQLPPGTQTRLKDEPKEIVICDYIAGMTDRFAHLEHQKLFDPHTLV